MLQIPTLYIVDTENKGKGVYTSQEIPNGATIEICPTILIPKEEVEAIHKTVLHDYYFRWGTEYDQAAIALGYGSIYNHADVPNAEFILDYNDNTIIITAIKEIQGGEEITVNYINSNIRNDKLWFTPEK